MEAGGKQGGGLLEGLEGKGLLVTEGPHILLLQRRPVLRRCR